MRFIWDESKRKTNLRDHGFDFVDASTVFDGPTFTVVDDRFAYDEERFLTLGLLDGLVVSIVHTETRSSIRVISFRKATKNEQTTFFQQIQN